jgi:hypothetical protein
MGTAIVRPKNAMAVRTCKNMTACVDGKGSNTLIRQAVIDERPAHATI